MADHLLLGLGTGGMLRRMSASGRVVLCGLVLAVAALLLSSLSVVLGAVVGACALLVVLLGLVAFAVRWGASDAAQDRR